MKTLVFCTSYAASTEAWDKRYRFWLSSLRRSGLRHDFALIVDDGSASAPEWEDASVLCELQGARIEELCFSNPVGVFQFRERLGAHSLYNVPGWYRSFSFGVRFGLKHGFDKIIHLESDAHLISKRVVDELNVSSEGWSALWSPKYDMPEIAVQIIAGTDLARAAAFVEQDYSVLIDRVHEFELPITHALKHLQGDRHSEDTLVVPRRADFSTQVLADSAPNYAWWMSEDANSRRHEVNAALAFHIGPRDFGSAGIFGGVWSTEPELKWAQETDTRIFIPPLVRGEYQLSLDLNPLVGPGRRRQRLILLWNDLLIGEYDLYRRVILQSIVPARVIEQDRENILRLIHPDAISPNALWNQPDLRRLSLALHDLGVRRLDDQLAPAAPECVF